MHLGQLTRQADEREVICRYADRKIRDCLHFGIRIRVLFIAGL